MSLKDAEKLARKYLGQLGRAGIAQRQARPCRLYIQGPYLPDVRGRGQTFEEALEDLLERESLERGARRRGGR